MKSFILKSEEDWRKYKNEMEQKAARKHRVSYIGHDSDPEEFPCVVMSKVCKRRFKEKSVQKIGYYYAHGFVYPETAEKLLETVE